MLDVDPRHGGDESLADFEAAYGPLPPTPSVLTGGGGQHFWLRAPDGVAISNSTGKLSPGLDIRSDGGYVVAPPSRHASGELYRWAAEAHLDDLKISLAPESLLRLLSSRAPAPSVAGAIPEGERNTKLASLAGSMRHRGMEPNEIEAALLAVNARAGLPEDEVSQIARSVGRYAPGPSPKIDLTPENGSSARVRIALDCRKGC
ncbi:MAG: bifunctional DNA primase/polymerase, partial [Chloroflexi bacterium]|nr:bifunctional DNA primase/polymerase [Chloroflexota bacterium]